MVLDYRFSLCEHDILSVLYCYDGSYISQRCSWQEDTPFDEFLYPDLIRVLYEKQYKQAHRLLNEMTSTLPHQEALVACLCALHGSDRLFQKILDICPPVPEFQFAGPTSLPLLLTAVKLDQPKKVRMLLRRGADPNRGSGECSPLEAAFINVYYPVLRDLLSHPSTEVELTESMLDAWGRLISDPDAKGKDLMRQWCCQLLHEKRNPAPPIGIFQIDIAPIPPELRLRHALKHRNFSLAVRLCEENKVESEDVNLLFNFFHWTFPRPSEEPPSLELLLSFLRHFPEHVTDPALRRTIVGFAVSTEMPNEELLALAEKLPDGPVHLHTDDLLYLLNGSRLPRLLSRWSNRLSDRLVPTLALQNTKAEILISYFHNNYLHHFHCTGNFSDSNLDYFLH